MKKVDNASLCLQACLIFFGAFEPSLSPSKLDIATPVVSLSKLELLWLPAS